MRAKSYAVLSSVIAAEILLRASVALSPALTSSGLIHIIQRDAYLRLNELGDEFVPGGDAITVFTFGGTISLE